MPFLLSIVQDSSRILSCRLHRSNSSSGFRLILISGCLLITPLALQGASISIRSKASPFHQDVLLLASPCTTLQLSFNRQRYYLFGHSAGSQFVHRMILFSPSEKIIAAVAANAGWYTEPDLEIEFPYGMANTLEGDTKFPQSFSKKLIIILGEDDDNENHRGLRTTAEAMVQGLHRLARGHNFYRRSKAVARKLGLPFKWQLKVIPDVGHSGWGMADPAADVLFGKD